MSGAVVRILRMPQADGWTWEYFSDRVMGGRSELVPPGIMGAGSDRALHLSGTVNTKGGGFIQARIRREKGAVDASSWKGIEATIEWRGGKATLRIPWSSFEGASARQPGVPLAVRIPGRAVEYSVLPSNSPLAVKIAFRDSGSLAKWS